MYSWRTINTKLDKNKRQIGLEDEGMKWCQSS
jgi:hypothetical protein